MTTNGNLPADVQAKDINPDGPRKPGRSTPPDAAAVRLVQWLNRKRRERGLRRDEIEDD